MFPREIIKQIQRHDGIGAGNFLDVLASMPVDLTQPILSIDQCIPLYVKQKTSFSILDLQQLALEVAAKYCGLGVNVGDLIGLYLEDDLSYFIHYLALNRLGAVPVCINDKLSEEIVAEFCVRTSINTLICTEKKELVLGQNTTAFGQVMSDKKLMMFSNHPLPPAKAFAEHDLVLLAHTSGTTGIPKAVTFSHEGFFYGVRSQLHKQRGEHVLSALPHSHSSAISVLMSSLLRGASIRLLSDKRPVKLSATIRDYRHDLIIAFPKTYVDLCRESLEPSDFSSVNYWIATGDANHESHIRKLISLGQYCIGNELKKGSIFIDNLGSSEFGFAMFRNIHSLEKNKFNRCIGRPFEWVEAAVLSPEGKPLAPGHIGQLGVKSNTVTSGYWNNAELTGEAKLSGYWLTGDLVYFDDDGLFYHVDRTTDPIYTNDGVLYSCLTEELILNHFPEVFDCSIYASLNNEGMTSSVPHICVELSAEAKDTQESDLLIKINLLLEEHAIPQIQNLIYQSAHAHTGVTGKKLKRQLRKLMEAA